MADYDRRFARSSSTQESSTRPAQHRPATQRGGVTSPSATSTSSDDNGGASLGARLASISLDDMSTKAKNSAVYNSKARKENPSQKFQYGVDPEDGDVFGDATTATSGVPSAFPQTHVPTPIRGVVSHDGAEFSVSRGHDQRGNSRYASDYTTPGRQTGSGTMVMNPRSDPRSAGTPAHRRDSVDAQAYYPPGACVFVANLPEGVEDSRLEREVTEHFMRFGTVFAKIRRDSRNMPFAFCQFTKEEDAQLGLIEGRGILIHGRACRTEMVRANRTYIIHRFNGDDLEVDEARFALESVGLVDVERCFPLPEDAQRALGMNKAVMFELKKFDPAKEVQSAFRHNPRYRVMAYDPKKASQAAKVGADEAWMQRYDIDRRSIYIGDLPANMEEMEAAIRDVVDEIGDVVEVQVVRKATQVGMAPLVFAFVEFTRPDMADLAVERLHNQVVFGRVVRVERKAHRDAAILRNSHRMGNEQGSRETYRSPLSGSRLSGSRLSGSRLSGSRYRGYGNNMPETPLRSRGFKPQHGLTAESPAMGSPGQSFSSTPAHMQWPSSFRGHDMGSPSTYATSDYTGGYAGNNQAQAGMMGPFYYPPPHMAWSQSPYMPPPEYSTYYTPGYVNTPARGEDKDKASGQRGRKSSGEASEKESGAGNAGNAA